MKVMKKALLLILLVLSALRLAEEDAAMRAGEREVSETGKGAPTSAGARWKELAVPKSRSEALAWQEKMLRLAKENPRKAMAESLSWAEWVALPQEIKEVVERPFSEVGEYIVSTYCFGREHGHDMPVRRQARMGGVYYEAQVYGGMLGLGSKEGMPMRGFVLKELAVISDRPVERVEGENLEAALELFGRGSAAGTSWTSGETTEGKGRALLIGGKIFEVGEQDEAEIQSVLRAAQRSLHPQSFGMAFGAGGRLGAGLFEAAAARQAAAQAGSLWAETPKKVLAVRISYSSSPTAFSLSPAAVSSAMGIASDALRRFSYGKTWMETTNITLVLPDSKEAFEAAGPLVIRDTVRAELDNLGMNREQFDIIMHFLPQMGGPAFGWAGLANARDSFINGPLAGGGFGPPTLNTVLLHELGHNYGLGHAHSWLSLTGNGGISRVMPDGTAGEHAEYGDIFDVMGNELSGDGHFGPRMKAHLNWLEEKDILTVRSNGIYRVFQFDHAEARNQSGKLALRIVSPAGEENWIALRKNIPGQLTSVVPGAYIVRTDAGTWQASGALQTLVDTSPYSQLDQSADAADPLLAVGKSYVEPVGAFTVTTLAMGGISPGAYVDLQIIFHEPSIAWYADAGHKTNGLAGSYFNETLRWSDEQDWLVVPGRTVTHRRVDDPAAFFLPSFGKRPGGLTGGMEEDWDEFSVQWDGWLEVRRPSILGLISDDGSRIWIDRNQDGRFENDAEEMLSNHWGNAGIWRSPPTAVLSPGSYRVRIQYEEGQFGNFFVLRAAEATVRLFTDASMTTEGFVASYLAQDMRGVPVEKDWRVKQAISGSRIETYPSFFGSRSFGALADVGLSWGINGTDEDWDNFAIQWDGYISNSVPMRLGTITEDGCRMFVDMNGDGVLEENFRERFVTGWPNLDYVMWGARTPVIPPGMRAIRIQYTELDRGNRFMLASLAHQPPTWNILMQSRVFNGMEHLAQSRTIGEDFTIELWVRTTDASGSAANWREGKVLADASHTSAKGDFGVTLGAGRVLFGVEQSETMRSGFVADGNWHFVAAVRDQRGGKLRLYVNGELCGETGAVSGSLNASDNIYLGARADGSRGFIGTIERFTVWTVARNAVEVVTDLHLSRQSRWPDTGQMRITPQGGGIS